ncbi:hypothetical protein [Edaphobacter dinghuensis]|uniref:Uncharacterized protein n=2 Tax=Edaphobacter dinghuensis TaxID=1560005 RepID=A0A917HI62_9BACT|nr:hypothetical protein [Edaphobacter dinghuensis]GGG79306.1 hypothetical protein GCM10011585_23280 [Edaphobacter dinghuensis]
MLLEVAKPIALLLCMLSLCAVFHTAFLVPASDLHQTLLDSLELLSLAAGISLISGLIFRESVEEPSADNKRLMTTLPVQVFYWATSIMLLLFVCCWYLESHCIFYRDVRRF